MPFSRDVIRYAEKHHESILDFLLTNETDQSELPNKITIYDRDRLIDTRLYYYKQRLGQIIPYSTLFLNQHVIDLGCGFGFAGPVIKNLGAKSVTGIDPYNENITKAKKYYDRTLTKSNQHVDNSIYENTVVYCRSVWFNNLYKDLQHIFQGLPNTFILIRAHNNMQSRNSDNKNNFGWIDDDFAEHDLTLNELTDLIQTYQPHADVMLDISLYKKFSIKKLVVTNLL